MYKKKCLQRRAPAETYCADRTYLDSDTCCGVLSLSSHGRPLALFKNVHKKMGYNFHSIQDSELKKMIKMYNPMSIC